MGKRVHARRSPFPLPEGRGNKARERDEGGNAMPKFAANLSMMFQEVGFLARFEAAAKAGFRGVEYLFPYDFPAADIVERLKKHNLTQALFNLPPGDWAKGERGLGAQPGREAEFREGVARAIDYAKATQCRTLHVMAGLWPAG